MFVEVYRLQRSGLQVCNLRFVKQNNAELKPKQGFGLVFCAWFDNLEIRHKGAIIAQETHYDPWGLELVGIGRQGLNRFTFNGQSEKQANLADGKGYFYETDFRSYDATLGRFHAYDLMARFYSAITPYNYAGNNPLSFNDPSGLDFFKGSNGGGMWREGSENFTNDDGETFTSIGKSTSVHANGATTTSTENKDGKGFTDTVVDDPSSNTKGTELSTPQGNTWQEEGERLYNEGEQIVQQVNEGVKEFVQTAVPVVIVTVTVLAAVGFFEMLNMAIAYSWLPYVVDVPTITAESIKSSILKMTGQGRELPENITDNPRIFKKWVENNLTNPATDNPLTDDQARTLIQAADRLGLLRFDQGRYTLLAETHTDDVTSDYYNVPHIHLMGFHIPVLNPNFEY